MAVFKCKMCGGALDIMEGMRIAECQYCASKQTLPKLNNDSKEPLYDRANHFRRNNEFDKASAIYEQILNEDTTDSEAYWSLVLCKYGIEYVKDPATNKRITTVNRTQFTSIFDDENYKAALQYADAEQKAIYESEAKAINEIQRGILSISQKEDPFDVFICYKETDAHGRRTPDSVLANDLYHQLSQEGFKVFFSRITLEDKLGAAYEPYIFAALNSAKVMVALGTKPEYFQAVWVRNEWSRYLSLIKSGAKKILVPAYKDMDPYDLPEEFSHLQAQDMSKLGFMQDLIRGIKKIIQVDTPKAATGQAVQDNTTNLQALLKRASLFLIDKNWSSVHEYCEKVLDIDPECSDAYLYSLLADCKVQQENELMNVSESFLDNANYKKVMLFANDEVKNRISTYACDVAYRYASLKMSGQFYLAAMESFEKILNYKDAEDKYTQCKINIEKIQKAYNALRSAKEQAKIDIENRYEDTAIKSNKYKKRGTTCLVLGAVAFVFSFMTIASGSYDLVTVLPPLFITLILMFIGSAFLILSSRKNQKLQYRDAEIKALDGKYKVTQVMLNNIKGQAVQAKPDPQQTINLYDVILVDSGATKLQTIRVIRELTGLDLAGAKNLADNVPSTIKTGLTASGAEQIMRSFEAVGATVNLVTANRT